MEIARMVVLRPEARDNVFQLFGQSARALLQTANVVPRIFCRLNTFQVDAPVNPIQLLAQIDCMLHGVAGLSICPSQLQRPERNKISQRTRFRLFDIREGGELPGYSWPRER